MKTGIMLQGQLRRPDDQLRMTIDSLVDGFPDAGFHFTVWREDYETRRDIVDDVLLEVGTVDVIEEFDIHYQPYLDNLDVYDNYQYRKKADDPNPPRHPHQTKQILLHNELMRKYGSNYDVIGRSRYDSTVSPIIDWKPYLREVIEKPSVVTMIARTNLYHDFRQLVGSVDNYDGKTPFMVFYNEKHDGFFAADVSEHMMLADSGIFFHRVEDWDCDLVERLHKDKKLLAAEFGWHQILVQGTSHGNWRQYEGGAQLTRCIPPDQYNQMKEILYS